MAAMSASSSSSSSSSSSKVHLPLIFVTAAAALFVALWVTSPDLQHVVIAFSPSLARVLHHTSIALLTPFMRYRQYGPVRLHYFAGRGRGEPIRLLLEDAQIEWTSTDFTSETWPAHKSDPIYTFGQVPLLEERDSNFTLVQSMAILRHVAERTGYSCDLGTAMTIYCDMVSMGAEDLHRMYSKTIYHENLDASMLDAYLARDVLTMLAHFDRLLKGTRNVQVVTWVDFLLFVELENHRELKSNVLDTFPALQKFYSDISRRPNIARWLFSKRRAAFKLPNGKTIDLPRK